MGWYECVCNNQVLQDVELVVLIPTKISYHVGDNATLNCHGSTEKQTPNSEVHIYWEKDGQTVLNVTAGNTTYGPGFENRVSVSKDAYRQGDLSITLLDVRLSDQGNYQCFFGSKVMGIPGGVTLTVTVPVQEKHSGDTGMLSMWVVMGLIVVMLLVIIVCFEVSELVSGLTGLIHGMIPCRVPSH